MIVEGAAKTTIYQKYRVQVTFAEGLGAAMLVMTEADGTARCYPLEADIAERVSADLAGLVGKPKIETATAQDLQNLNGHGPQG